MLIISAMGEAGDVSVLKVGLDQLVFKVVTLINLANIWGYKPIVVLSALRIISRCWHFLGLEVCATGFKLILRHSREYSIINTSLSNVLLILKLWDGLLPNGIV